MHLHLIRGPELDRITLGSVNTVGAALDAMNTSALQIVIVTDAHDQFFGILTDGDLRRFLAESGAITAPLELAVNRSPIVAARSLSRREATAELDRSALEYLPFVEEGRVRELYAMLARRPARNLSVVIMAGGLGIRMRPLTNSLPKPLLEIGGRSVLGHLLDGLIRQGINDFTICVNYLGHMIVDRFGDGSSLGVQIRYVHESKRLGTGGALRLIDHQLTDPFLCINADLLTDFDCADAVQLHLANEWAATMIVRQHTVNIPYGVVETEEDGRFTGFDEKPTLQFAVNAGIYVLSNHVLDSIPDNEFFDLPTAFDLLAAEGTPVGTWEFTGRCIDIGTPEEWERVQRAMKDQDPSARPLGIPND